MKTFSAVALTLFALTLCGCKSVPLMRPKAEAPTPAPAAFQPANYVARIQHARGQYPDLFSPDSQAVWVSPTVAELKQEQEVQEGLPVDPLLERDARQITEDYFVVECHMASMFGDMSVAYDVVGFRGVEVYLEAADGARTAPVQIVIGPMEEEQREALKMFQRMNVLIFPRQDLWLGTPTVGRGAASVRLALEAHGATYYFEWPGAGAATEKPVGADLAQAVKVGYTELFSRIRQLAHAFR